MEPLCQSLGAAVMKPHIWGAYGTDGISHGSEGCTSEVKVWAELVAGTVASGSRMPPSGVLSWLEGEGEFRGVLLI